MFRFTIPAASRMCDRCPGDCAGCPRRAARGRGAQPAASGLPDLQGARCRHDLHRDPPSRSRSPSCSPSSSAAAAPTRSTSTTRASIYQRVTRWYNADGDLTRRVIRERWKPAWWSNPLTGKTVPYTQNQKITTVLAVPGDFDSATETMVGENIYTDPVTHRKVLQSTGRVVFGADGDARLPGGTAVVPRRVRRRRHVRPRRRVRGAGVVGSPRSVGRWASWPGPS